MVALQKGLGRGLGALFQDDLPEKSNAAGPVSDVAKILPLLSLCPNPNQPRKDFTRESLDELAASIKAQGVLQPILARPLPGRIQEGKYEIVAGERRWRAAQIAGLNEVPVVVRELSDQQTLALALIENLQREDLNPLEEAWGMQRLRDEFGLSQEELARQIGKSRSAVANSLRLLNLSENAQQNLRQGRISAGHARALLAVEDPEQRENLRKRILAEQLSVREAEGLAFSAKADPVSNTPAPAPAEKEKTPVPRPKKPQSVLLLDIQNRLSQTLCLPVKMSGRVDSGRLNIKYASREELQSLLAKLGLEEIND